MPWFGPEVVGGLEWLRVRVRVYSRGVGLV